jgi:anti-sigma regulatory factor (Ser/Thr protein kinase)
MSGGIIEREIVLQAELGELDRLLDWVGALLEEAHCSPKVSNQISVVTEELFVNIASYAYADAASTGAAPGEALISFRLEGGVMVMRFEDSGIPFNPLDYKAPDITAGIEERGIGGLGIYMTRKWMESVTYERKGGRNILTLTKTLG